MSVYIIIIIREVRLRKMFKKTETDENQIEYYYMGEKDINELLNIRRRWDEYIVNEGENGSKIPWYFIEAPPPSNYIWESYLLEQPNQNQNQNQNK